MARGAGHLQPGRPRRRADYRGLGIVRGLGLGRHGVRVWMVQDTDDFQARVSRYAARSPRLDRQDWDRLVSFLCDLGEREGLSRWVLFPTSDEAAAPVARRHAELARIYRMTVPP